jgi:hypothetical protein
VCAYVHVDEEWGLYEVISAGRHSSSRLRVRTNLRTYVRGVVEKGLKIDMCTISLKAQLHLDCSHQLGLCGACDDLCGACDDQNFKHEICQDHACIHTI